MRFQSVDMRVVERLIDSMLHMKLDKMRVLLLTILVLFSLCIENSEDIPVIVNASTQWDPAIYKDIVVWQDDRNGNWDIYGFDLSAKEEFQITTDESDQRYPAIYSSIVVWQDDRNGNWDIYGFDLSIREEFQITTDGSDQWRPAIYGDIIVWRDDRNGNKDIYAYNLSTEEEFQITTNTSAQYYPVIYHLIPFFSHPFILTLSAAASRADMKMLHV